MAKKSVHFLNRQAEIWYRKTMIGYLGEVHPLVASAYGIGEKTYIAMLDMKSLLPFAGFQTKFKGIAKYPAVTRDISMVVPRKVSAGQIEEVIRKGGGKILESYALFDIYEGAQILAGFKSMAYNITFRASDRTLEDKEVNVHMDKILEGLKEIGIKLRE